MKNIIFDALSLHLTLNFLKCVSRGNHALAHKRNPLVGVFVQFFRVCFISFHNYMVSRQNLFYKFISRVSARDDADVADALYGYPDISHLRSYFLGKSFPNTT